METRSFTSENEQHFEHRDIFDNNNTTKCEEKSLQKNERIWTAKATRPNKFFNGRNFRFIAITSSCIKNKNQSQFLEIKSSRSVVMLLALQNLCAALIPMGNIMAGR